MSGTGREHNPNHGGGHKDQPAGEGGRHNVPFN